MASEILKRVAEAIGAESENRGDDLYQRCARAAIEAMREPTKEMVRAGGDAVYESGGTGTEIDDRSAKAAWRGMIDAAAL